MNSDNPNAYISLLVYVLHPLWLTRHEPHA